MIMLVLCIPQSLTLKNLHSPLVEASPHQMMPQCDPRKKLYVSAEFNCWPCA